jgi:hypothetical protein
METIVPNMSLVLDTNHIRRTSSVTELAVFSTYFVLALIFEVYVFYVWC